MWTPISHFKRWSPLVLHWSNVCRTSSKSSASSPTRSRIPKWSLQWESWGTWSWRRWSRGSCEERDAWGMGWPGSYSLYWSSSSPSAAWRPARKKSKQWRWWLARCREPKTHLCGPSGAPASRSWFRRASWWCGYETGTRSRRAGMRCQWRGRWREGPTRSPSRDPDCSGPQKQTPLNTSPSICPMARMLIVFTAGTAQAARWKYWELASIASWPHFIPAARNQVRDRMTHQIEDAILKKYSIMNRIVHPSFFVPWTMVL